MSRHFPPHNPTQTFEAVEFWRDRCLNGNRSVFAEANLWEIGALQELETHFIKNYVHGDASFFDKLAEQLEPTSPEVKQLTAEMLWVMLLCPSNISPQKKREGIQQIWRWSGSEISSDIKWLSDEVLDGIGSGGTSYNTNRWRELTFFIRTMLAFKRLSANEQAVLLSDGWEFAKWLEGIPEAESRQLRHMLLFLLFPDQFERIFGGTDRRAVVAAFTGRSKAQTKHMSPLEIDRTLADIRRKEEQSYGTAELDFYLPPLKAKWKGGAELRAWLFVWNPANWSWGTLVEDRKLTHGGKGVIQRWSCANHDIAIGDKAYLRKSGNPPRGIVAVGNVVSEPTEDVHWDETQAAAGKTSWYVEIEFSRIQDPAQYDPYISDDDLADIKGDQQWAPQSSGIEIKPSAVMALDKLWQEKIEMDTKGDESKSKAKPKVFTPQNIILYGPPGTGKTFQLNKLKAQYVSSQQSLSREVWLTQQLLEASWFDAIVAALYELGGKAKVGAIAEHEYLQLKAHAQGGTKILKNKIWGALQSHTTDASTTVNYKNRQPPQVFDKTPGSEWFFIDEWQEACEEQRQLAESWRAGPAAGRIQERHAFVTFHQAYSYEDFIEGIRPVRDAESGEMSYEVVPGVFRRICQQAKADPQHRYAIFIDEINRGNIAKIFGELITLVEQDKRASYAADGQFEGKGMEVILPYSGDRFGVPQNLDIYGAMNTADRSIALLDTALRRRFRFQELMPNASYITGSQGDGQIADGESGWIDLRALLDAMNSRIRFLLNRDMTLGHSYFLEIRTFDELREVLLHQIIPLLQEYFYEDWHRIQLVFRDVGPSGDKQEPQIICHEAVNELAVLGFDHDDFNDRVEYWVAKPEEITPDAVRKVYEEVS